MSKIWSEAYYMYVGVANAFESLGICAGWPESLLLDNAIYSKISCAGPSTGFI